MAVHKLFHSKLREVWVGDDGGVGEESGPDEEESFHLHPASALRDFSREKNIT